MRFWAASFVFSAVPLLAQAVPTELTVDTPVIGVGTGYAGFTPVRVSFKAKGNREEHGTIRCSTEAGQASAPFTVRPGETVRQEIIVPVHSLTQAFQVEVVTDQGFVSSRIPIGYEPASTWLAFVGVSAARFSWASGRSNPPGYAASRLYVESFGTADVLPGKAPTKAVSYSGFYAVVLGEGAAKLKDTEVKALKDYVQMGGGLIFLGGAGTPQAKDPRWKDCLPSNYRRLDLQPVTVSSDERLPAQDRAQRIVSNAFPASTREARRQFGAGWVEIVDWDPASDRISSLNSDSLAIKQAFGRLVGKYVVGGNPNGVQQIDSLPPDLNADAIKALEPNPLEIPQGTGFPKGPDPASLASGGKGVKDPFKMSPPNAGVVFGILVLYWLILIPIHFGILGKTKKQALGWVTAPLIAVLFSFGFFGLASGLYSSKASKTQAGWLAADGRSSEAWVVGTQQLFFPSSGTADLKFGDVQGVWDTFNAYGGRARVSGYGITSDVTQADHCEAKAVKTSSLNFKEFGFIERVPFGGGFTANLWREQKGRIWLIKAKITNKSPFDLQDARFHLSGIRDFESGKISLKKGETQTLTLAMTGNVVGDKLIHDVVLHGRVAGAQFGSRFGDMIDRNDSINAIITIGTLDLGKQK